METKIALILNQKHLDPKSHFSKVQACIDYCENNNFELAKRVSFESYALNEGYDPLDMRWTEDLYCLKNKHCTHVIFYSVKDLGLTTREFLNFMHHAKEQNITLYCLTSNVDSDTAFGRFMLQTLSIFAEHERQHENELKSCKT